MARKLAIVISGAVSLGSYEAGVMYELLEAIALRNELLKSEHPERYEQDRVIIDVITGASAGAMTAAILGQQLYYGGDRLRDPYNNPLFNAWVKDVNIDGLLQVPRNNHKYALLSSAVVDDIGEEYIADDPGDALNCHPAAADSLRIGLAMANLNGFSQEIAKEKKSFAYSRYKDQFVCLLRCVIPEDIQSISSGEEVKRTVQLTELEPRWKERHVVWRPMLNICSWPILRLMALSSGAFPFAFRARRIVRTGGSSASLMRTRDSSRKATAGDQLYGGNYLYTDGGVFENEPIGMAASLAKEIDEKDGHSQRNYLFVAPGKRTIDADPFFNREDNLLAMAIGLASAVFGQSRFQQWVTEGLEGKLLTVTASDALLIGDVFSAFAGFLEFEFRSYDYNIGRRNARQQLREGQFTDLIGDFHDIDRKMPFIDWLPDWPISTQSHQESSASASACAANPFSHEQIQDGYVEHETDSWKRVRDHLVGLAQPCIIEEDGERRRDQLQELRKLMGRVDPRRRVLIAEQISARVDSLVDFFHKDYLDKLDARRRYGPLRWMLRQIIGKPLTKLILRRLITPVLEVNVLRPEP
ncbi:patatin-like phospholipase family protein [Synechococcus sp. 1G10]|uniref:patatin-like phospholipase family protein n=1 Tax=Synechococcus sp. 1G10 TaxID=2025605 RepID=UPI000B98F649|nr:patatin-like phospholipase family protein [Synechococcus sp. 1G10]